MLNPHLYFLFFFVTESFPADSQNDRVPLYPILIPLDSVLSLLLHLYEGNVAVCHLLVARTEKEFKTVKRIVQS
jgi:hypothetical protein